MTRSLQTVAGAGSPSPDPLAGLRRTNVPHRNRTPAPANWTPLGLWTESGTFTSYKTAGIVLYWSDVQLDALTLLEVDPRVRWMRARPEPVRWHDGQGWKEHFPSFEVGISNGSILVEVAPREDDFDAIRAAARSVGRTMVPLRFRDIRLQPRLENAREICACSSQRVPDEDLRAVLSVLGLPGTDTIGGVAQRTALGFGECLAALLKLVWRGAVTVDMGLPFDARTPVWRVP